MRLGFQDSLRVFEVAARHLSFTSAAAALNLTKGAISYQVNRLERELGFAVFIRRNRGIALTAKGKRLWHACQGAFRDLDREIAELQEPERGRITIGMSTYFASRWLSPRLMTFTAGHPGIALRLQPLVDLIDIRAAGIDMAVRWGKGDWADMEIEPLFPCPAFPTAGAAIAGRVADAGLAAVLPGAPLLHDRDGSAAWRDWHDAAGLAFRATRADLVIPDPNVRVQAVIDGQGIALNDELVAPELSAGRLFRISTVELRDYGYHLAYPRGALHAAELATFRDWIMAAANPEQATARPQPGSTAGKSRLRSRRP